jgi:uncharacterized protein YndB with AHSA1/START domain
MNKTTVKAEPGKQELFIQRDFEAPRELVFRTFTESKLLSQWLSPCGMTIQVEKLEPEGGSWRFINSTPDGKTFGFHGVMHEVLPPERIIRTFEFEGLPEKGHVILETLKMEPLSNNRTRVTIQSVFQSVADRDGMVASGVESGTSEAHQLLDDLLAKLQPTAATVSR